MNIIGTDTATKNTGITTIGTKHCGLGGQIMGARGFWEQQAASGLADLVRARLAHSRPEKELHNFADEIKLMAVSDVDSVQLDRKGPSKIGIEQVSLAFFSVPVRARRRSKRKPRSRRRPARR